MKNTVTPAPDFSELPDQLPAVEVATKEDLEEILALQKVAYQSEAEIINNFLIPPLLETLDEFRRSYSDPERPMILLKMVKDSRIIGSVRAYEKADTTYIGRLMVLQK